MTAGKCCEFYNRTRNLMNVLANTKWFYSTERRGLRGSVQAKSE